jgi:hypothetical protein
MPDMATTDDEVVVVQAPARDAVTLLRSGDADFPAPAQELSAIFA